MNRFYTSADAAEGPFGRGWSLGYDVRLTVQGSEALLKAGSGQRIKFTQNPDGSFTAPTGATSGLVRNQDGTFTVTTRSGLVHSFDTAGRKASCGDAVAEALLSTAAIVPGGRLIKGAASGVKSLSGASKAANTRAKACSFSGATVVLMADGSRKPIEDVKVGDKVIATDPETGEQEAKTVDRVFVHDDTVIDLAIGGEVITTTEDNPFWSVTDQHFERADQLESGEEVLGADGRIITVSGLELWTGRQSLAYNLSRNPHLPRRSIRDTRPQHLSAAAHELGPAVEALPRAPELYRRTQPTHSQSRGAASAGRHWYTCQPYPARSGRF